MGRRGCGPKRRKVHETEEAARQAALAAAIGYRREHTIEKCGEHWHVTRVVSGGR